MAYCAYCKSRIFQQDQKCPNCGSTRFLTDDEPVRAEKPREPQVEYHTVYVEKPVYRDVYVEVPARSDKSWVATLLLCFFFGVFGFHRFYVGKIGTGVLFLLTFGWCGIGWLVDMILILAGGFRDGDGLRMNR